MGAPSQHLFPFGASAIAPITCPRCKGRALLMRRTPTGQRPGEERQTFECEDCGAKTERVATV